MDETDLRDALRRLLTEQRLAALSTYSETGCYASLVGFVATDEMKTLVFATARATRKYGNLAREPRVALLIDSRSNRDEDFHEAIAATARGTAEEVEGEERARLAALYLDKHPHLRDFIASPTCALIRVRVYAYHVVSRFQDVSVLDPNV